MTVKFIGLNSIYYPYTRVRCYNFAQSLRKSGIKAEVFGLSARYCKDPKEKLFNPRDLKKLYLQMKLFKDLFSSSPKKDIFYFQKIHHHITAPYLIHRLKKVPFIVDYDDWEFDRSPFFNKRILNKLFFGSSDMAKINEKLIKEAFLCIAASHHLQRKLEQLNEKTFLVQTGVDIKKFDGEKLANNHPYPVFIWSGEIWGPLILENLIFILSSFSYINNLYPNWKLMFVVYGEFVPSLKKIIKHSYSNLPIEVYENVNPDDMPKIYAKANVGLLPLFCDEKDYDWVKSKSPTKLFEYMAMKLIPVCHKIGEAIYVLENKKTGFFFSNQKEFIKIIEFILTHFDELKYMREETYREVKKKYSLEVLGEKLATVLQTHASEYLK